MLYLSQLLKKPIIFQNKPYGKVVDFSLSEDLQRGTVAKVITKHNGMRYAIPAAALIFSDGQFILSEDIATPISSSEKDFYLDEDLLDKQVIDVTGRRLVRVNDVVLKQNGKLTVSGIDIGFSAILRRFGLGMFRTSITLPWSVIEAFDYETGDVRVKVAQSNLNALQPAEIADLLEDVGAKERLGIVEALNAQNAARALEEADEETQESILESLPQNQLKNIIDRMPVSEIADVLDRLNPFTKRAIFQYLGQEKAQKVRKLAIYADDVAGGLMDITFVTVTKTTAVKETLELLSKQKIVPEIVIIVDENKKYLGVSPTKNLLNAESDAPIATLITEQQYATAATEFDDILRIFAEYNLRALPVVDHEMKVIGVVQIDSVLASIQKDEEEQYESI